MVARRFTRRNLSDGARRVGRDGELANPSNCLAFIDELERLAEHRG